MNILHNASIEIRAVFVNGSAYYAEVVSCSGLLLHETGKYITRQAALSAAETWIDSVQTEEERAA